MTLLIILTLVLLLPTKHGGCLLDWKNVDFIRSPPQSSEPHNERTHDNIDSGIDFFGYQVRVGLKRWVPAWFRFGSRLSVNKMHTENILIMCRWIFLIKVESSMFFSGTFLLEHLTGEHQLTIPTLKVSKYDSFYFMVMS